MKSQRCRLLALQSHLQCALEAGQAALPAFRSEMDAIRKLTTEWREISIEQLTQIKYNLTQQIQQMFTCAEKTSENLLEKAKTQNQMLEQENQKLTDELLSIRCELEEWKKRSAQWQVERNELITSAQLCLQQREAELEQQRHDQLENERIKHIHELEALKEALKAAEDKCNIMTSEWQAASEQVYARSPSLSAYGMRNNFTLIDAL